MVCRVHSLVASQEKGRRGRGSVKPHWRRSDVARVGKRIGDREEYGMVEKEHANDDNVLPDLLAPGLSVVFVGTAAGTASKVRGAYYAGAGNKFWPILAATGLTPHQLRPEEYPELLQYGWGLTDVVKNQFGPDNRLHQSVASGDALWERLSRVSPAWIAFNGKTAAKWALRRSVIDYGEQNPQWGTMRLFVLPSTSGAANGHWNADFWHLFADRVLSS